MNKLLVRAKLAGRILRYVPFVRLVALNGSVVRGEENSQSDVDILVIAKSGRLYTTRFFATFFIALTGWRRHGEKISGRICLNCYLSDKNLSIIPEDKRNMAKVAKAYKHMIVLVDDGLEKKFFGVNKWFEDFEISGESHAKVLKELIFNKFPLFRRNHLVEKLFFRRFGEYVEKKMMNYQTKRIFAGAKKNDQIYADKFVIKLHPKKY